MTPALILERLMLHPHYDRIVEAVRAHTPTHIADQGDAASGHARQVASAIGELIEATTSASPMATMPGWLRLGLLTAHVEYLSGTARTCPHNPTPDRPQPVLAAAWQPGLIACLACAHLFSISRGSDKDRTCDACGYISPDSVHPALIQFGPLVYQYGTCEGCQPGIVAPPVRQRPAARGSRGRSRGRGRGRP